MTALHKPCEHELSMYAPAPVTETCTELSPTEEATANAIEAEFAALLDRWMSNGFPRNVIVPMTFILTVDAAKRCGVSFDSAVETLQLVWHGKPS